MFRRNQDSGRPFRGRVVALLAAGTLALSAFVPAGSPPTPRAAARTRPEVGRLRVLIEEGERAAQEKDWDTASTRADEADVLVADWPDELLDLPEVASLLGRLQDLEQHLPDSDAESEPGLKESAEVVPLAGDALRAELEYVRSAETGAVFDFPIDLNDKTAAWVLQFTTTKRGFMERALSRATQWLPMARQIFAEEGIPQDLAYLAVIESGFQNGARSYAKAVGMWQFIRSTGRIYGLSGDAWVEERRDPVKATRASARYLKRLYQTSGDWYLALVGYNAGPLTTERAIENLGSRNFWDMARSRWLRNQTKNYVPELLAAILVGHFPERYGLKVEQLQPYAYETVQVDRMTSLAVLARCAESDVETLRELNPELLRSTTPPGAYALRVPPGLSQTTARALARIPAAQRLDFKSYKVHRGDTLAKVAAKFHMSAEDLLDANDMKKSQFRPGRVIKVPPPPPAPIDDRDLLTAGQRAKAIEERPLESLPPIPISQGAASLSPEAVAPVKVKEPADVKEPAESKESRESKAPAHSESERAPKAARERAAAEHPRTHLVKAGETLYAISERYGIEIKDLRKWNKLKGNKIQVGQRLRLSK